MTPLVNYHNDSYDIDVFVHRVSGYNSSQYKGMGWRRRIAWYLRTLADNIDNRASYTIRVNGAPEYHKYVTASVIQDGVVFGMTAMRQYIVDAVRDAECVSGDEP